MKRFLAMALFGSVGYLSAQTVTVMSAHFTDSSGNPLSGYAYFQPVNCIGGYPMSYRLGGGGTVMSNPVQVVVTAGALSLTLPDTTQTYPANICFAMTYPQGTLPVGYSTLQPHTTASNTADWCQAGVCDLDNYLPSTQPLPTLNAVQSINYLGGQLTFTGSGVSQSGNTFTFTGAGLGSFTVGNLAPLFTASLGPNPTTNPSLNFTLSNAAQNSILAGPASGGAGAYSFQTTPTFNMASLTGMTSGQIITALGYTPVAPTVTSLADLIGAAGGNFGTAAYTSSSAYDVSGAASTAQSNAEAYASSAASTAQTNAETYASNASNLSSGTVAAARLSADNIEAALGFTPVSSTATTLPDLTTAAGGTFGTGAYVAAYALPIATTSVLGGVKPDGASCTVNISTGVLTCPGTYTLPSTVVQTDQANTYSTGLQDFSSANMKLPSSITVGSNTITQPSSSGTLALTSQLTGGTLTSVSVATANGFEGSSSGGAAPVLTLNTDSTHILPVNNEGSSLFLNGAGAYAIPPGSGVTTSSPLSGTTSLSCPTCVSSQSSLSSNNLMIGAGSQSAETVNLTGYVYSNGSSAPTASATIPYSALSGTVPTWNQNTTGTAANVTGTVAIANGGTGATTAATALSNLLPGASSDGSNGLVLTGAISPDLGYSIPTTAVSSGPNNPQPSYFGQFCGSAWATSAAVNACVGVFELSDWGANADTWLVLHNISGSSSLYTGMESSGGFRYNDNLKEYGIGNFSTYYGFGVSSGGSIGFHSGNFAYPNTPNTMSAADGYIHRLGVNSIGFGSLSNWDDGTFTTGNFIATGIATSASTPSICPNGTGGVFTQSGCTVTNVTGTVAIANGGTGATTAASGAAALVNGNPISPSTVAATTSISTPVAYPLQVGTQFFLDSFVNLFPTGGTYNGAWSNSTTYAMCQSVTYSGVQYVSGVNSNTATPGTGPGWMPTQTATTVAPTNYDCFLAAAYSQINFTNLGYLVWGGSNTYKKCLDLAWPVSTSTGSSLTLIGVSGGSNGSFLNAPATIIQQQSGCSTAEPLIYDPANATRTTSPTIENVLLDGNFQSPALMGIFNTVNSKIRHVYGQNELGTSWTGAPTDHGSAITGSFLLGANVNTCGAGSTSCGNVQGHWDDLQVKNQVGTNYTRLASLTVTIASGTATACSIPSTCLTNGTQPGGGSSSCTGLNYWNVPVAISQSQQCSVQPVIALTHTGSTAGSYAVSGCSISSGGTCLNGNGTTTYNALPADMPSGSYGILVACANCETSNLISDHGTVATIANDITNVKNDHWHTEFGPGIVDYSCGSAFQNADLDSTFFFGMSFQCAGATTTVTAPLLENGGYGFKPLNYGYTTFSASSSTDNIAITDATHSANAGWLGTNWDLWLQGSGTVDSLGSTQVFKVTRSVFPWAGNSGNTTTDRITNLEWFVNAITAPSATLNGTGLVLTATPVSSSAATDSYSTWVNGRTLFGYCGTTTCPASGTTLASGALIQTGGGRAFTIDVGNSTWGGTSGGGDQRFMIDAAGIGYGTNPASQSNPFHIDTSGDLTATKVNVASARKGTFTCTSGGTITVTNANGSATSDILFTTNTPGGTQTYVPIVTTPPAGTSFVVKCASLDTSTYNYDILN
jgi:hypothetical protein